MIAESAPDPIYHRDGIMLYAGDCADILRWLPLASIDHVITDPPYSTHVHGNGRRGVALARPGLERPVFSAERDLGFEPLAVDMRRLVACEAARLARRWVIVFCALEMIGDWAVSVDEAGLEYVRAGLWVKPGAAPQFSGDRPAVGAEGIVIAARRGRKTWNNGGAAGVWTNPPVHHAARLHPAEKPLRLMRELILAFTDPGDVVLDPFAGSGTTLRAALDVGRQAIGIERDLRWCGVAIDRLRQGVLPAPDPWGERV